MGDVDPLFGICPSVRDDTTGDDIWQPLRVTATLAEPVAALDLHAAHLDGPLSWGAFQLWQQTHGRHSLPPMGADSCVDFSLPLATWTRPAPDGAHPLTLTPDGQVWGWACSAAVYTPAAHTKVEIRRKPADRAMGRWAADRKHHVATGPLKARDGVVPAVVTREIVWWALGLPNPVRETLQPVTHLGRHTRHGHGQILSWAVQVDEAARDLWQRRVFPDPHGTPNTIRAPYHHPTRRMPCTQTN
jgi:hypothetical protein